MTTAPQAPAAAAASTPPAPPPETPEQVIERLTHEVQALETIIQDRQPAEAGFSVNFTMLDKEGASASLTFRGAVASDWRGVFRERGAFCEMALKHGWRFNVPEKAPELTPVALARQEGGEPAAQAVKTAMATAAAAQPTPDGAQFMNIIKVEIAQGKAPDRATLKLYTQGHTKPDLQYQNQTWERAAAMLSSIMKIEGMTAPIPNSNPPAIVIIPHTYDQRCVAVWKQGQAFTFVDSSGAKKDGFYKDLIELRPTV